MKGFILEYKNWKRLFEVAETDPIKEEEEVETVKASTFVLRIINNKVTRNNLLSVVNRKMSDILKEAMPAAKTEKIKTEDADLGTFNIWWKPTSGKITKLIPINLEGSNEKSNKGTFKGKVSVFVRIKNDVLIDEYVRPSQYGVSDTKANKGLQMSIPLYVGGNYTIDEKSDRFIFKVTTANLVYNKTIDTSTHSLLNMLKDWIGFKNFYVTIKGDMLSIKLNASKSLDILKEHPLGITDLIIGKNIEIDIENIKNLEV